MLVACRRGASSSACFCYIGSRLCLGDTQRIFAASYDYKDGFLEDPAGEEVESMDAFAVIK